MTNMKKTFLFLAAVGIMTAAFAQTSSDVFFSRYEGKSGFTSVNISEKMFEMLATVAPEDEAELKEMASGLKGIKVLIFENTEGNARTHELYKEAESTLSVKCFDELMNVYSDNERVRILSLQSGTDIINELVILVDDGEEFVLVDIFGIIDLKKLSKMAGSIDIDGLEKLEELNK